MAALQVSTRKIIERKPEFAQANHAIQNAKSPCGYHQVDMHMFSSPAPSTEIFTHFLCGHLSLFQYPLVIPVSL